MNARLQTKAKEAPAPLLKPVSTGLLQRQCACGGSAGLNSECEECSASRLSLQRTAPAMSRKEAEKAGEAPPSVHEVLRSPGQPPDLETRAYMESRFGHHFDGVRTHSSTMPPIPARLAVGAPRDPLEQEADTVAEQVTRLPAPLTGSRYDFGHVRIHADAQAAASARSINAQAFTVGHHIVFDAGEYAPHTVSGQRLLAHELAHVVQQSGYRASGDKAQRGFLEQRVTSPHLQGKWRLDRAKPASGVDVAYTRENGSAISSVNEDPGGLTGGAYGGAFTRQEQGFIHQQVGGEAQVADWVTKHYIFKNDGTDSEFLQLRVDGSLAGDAKAEDLRYARAGAVVWGRITKRTAANPTPPDQQLFEIEDGGISAATVGDLGVIEVEIPLGERGSAKITIPLKKVDEGTFIPFSESTHFLHDVPSTIDEVDVLLGARVEADADIETAFFGVSPLISQNRNNAQANGLFKLNWESRPAPGVAGPTALASCVANENLSEIADSFISRCCKASIRREFPSELLYETLGAIKQGSSAAHKKAWKLLNDNRFKK